MQQLAGVPVDPGNHPTHQLQPTPMTLTSYMVLKRRTRKPTVQLHIAQAACHMTPWTSTMMSRRHSSVQVVRSGRTGPRLPVLPSAGYQVCNLCKTLTKAHILADTMVVHVPRPTGTTKRIQLPYNTSWEDFQARIRPLMGIDKDEHPPLAWQTSKDPVRARNCLDDADDYAGIREALVGRRSVVEIILFDTSVETQVRCPPSLLPFVNRCYSRKVEQNSRSPGTRQMLLPLPRHTARHKARTN